MFEILYVDDEPALLELGRIFLEETGLFTLDTAASAPEALGMMAKKEYDAIISDYMMPEMDGIEFLIRVRTAKNPIPFILFTGRGRESVVIRAINEGADFYLQKGGEPRSQFAELAHKIRVAIERRQSIHDLHVYAERLAMAQAIGNTGSWELNLATGMIWGSEQAWRIFDLPRPENGLISKDEIGSRIPEFVRVHQALADLLESGKEYNIECTIETGSERKQKIIHSVGRLLCDSENRPAAVAGVIHDITERVQAREELQRKNSELNRAYNQLADQEVALRQQLDEIVTSQKALAESEEKYRTIFETTGAATIIIGPDTTITLGNAGFATLSGYSLEDLKGHHSWTEFIVREDLERMQKYHRDRREDTGSAPKIYEFRFIDRYGNIRHCINNVALIPGTELSVASVVDITDRVRAEQDNRNIFNSIQDVFYRTDPNGTIILMSPSGAKILGYSSVTELYGKNMAEALYLHPEDRKQFLTILDRTGEVINYEIILKKQDGTPVTALTSSHKYYGHQGEFLGVEGILRDITDRKRAEESLRQSEENYRIIVENTLEPVIIIDLEGTILFANRAAALLAKIPDPSLSIGTSALEFLAPESRETALSDLRSSAEGRDGYLVRYKVLTGDGQKRQVELIGKKTLFGKKPAIILMFREIIPDCWSDDSSRSG